MPGAEVEITVDLVRGLLRGQHPDLAGLPLRVAAHGWDNVMVQLGDTCAVRLPRRESAARLLEHELQWLPQLAAVLDGVRLPEPLRAGRPTAGYPWAWSVVPWFAGTAAIALPRTARAALAAPLARLCTALHRPAPTDAPANPVRGVPLSDRDRAVTERLNSGLVPHAAALRAVWQSGLAAPRWTGPAVWLHGDLHPANLVVEGGQLAALVDFGDMTAGDPATDLATAWLTFDAPARADFRRTYAGSGSGQEGTWRRARAWAVAIGAALCVSSDDAPELGRLGRETMTEILAD